MPRYYFHIRSGLEGDYLDIDPDGTHLRTLGAARAVAMKMAQELWADWPEADRDTVIEIANRDGQLLLVVSFSEAVGSEQ